MLSLRSEKEGITISVKNYFSPSAKKSVGGPRSLLKKLGFILKFYLPKRGYNDFRQHCFSSQFKNFEQVILWNMYACLTRSKSIKITIFVKKNCLPVPKLFSMLKKTLVFQIIMPKSLFCRNWFVWQCRKPQCGGNLRFVKNFGF